jgi:hypothetical protein
MAPMHHPIRRRDVQQERRRKQEIGRNFIEQRDIFEAT